MLFRSLPPGVVYSAVKRPRRGEGLVVRICEMHGEPRDFDWTVGDPKLVRAARMNFLEDETGEQPFEAGVLKMKLRPFEIATVGLFRQ